MSYPDLELKVEKLRSDVYKIKERLYKLEDGRDEKADPSELKSNKDYDALDWYKDRYQSIREDYNKISLELADKQKVLEQVMDQRDRYIKKLMDAEKKVKEFEENIHNLTKSNQRHRGIIKSHEDRIFDLEEEVRYHEAFGGSEKVKELEKLIEDYKVGAMGIRKRILELEERNEKLQKLNDVYTRIILNEDE